MAKEELIKNKIDRVAFGTLLAGAIIGLIASFVLSVEALTLAKNPDAVLECSVSVVLNCATVAKDASAELLGFPNSFIGLVTLPVMVTIAVAGLAGVKFPKWFMRAAWWGAVAGLGFAGWMFYESFYVIQALCPWCLTTDLAMLLVAYGIFRHNAREKYFSIMRDKLAEFSRKNYDLAATILIVVVLIAAIIVKYGNSLLA